MVFANFSRLSESEDDKYWDVYPIIHDEISEMSQYEVLSVDGQERSKQGQLGDLYVCLKRFTPKMERRQMNKNTHSSEIDLLIDSKYEAHIILRDGRSWRMLFRNENISGYFYLDCDGRYFDELLE